MQTKPILLFVLLAGIVFSSSLLADIVDPVGDIEINQNREFNVTVNVSCSDGACGDVNVSLNNYRSSCKALLDAGHSVGDGVYTIYPPGHPGGIDVYCDMTTDGGGWTLVFGGMGSTTTYSSIWYGWFAEGNTTNLTDKSTEGKSVAYDTVPVSTIMLESTYGTDGVIIADLDQSYDNLLDLVGPDPGCNDGSAQWNNGFEGPFNANYPANGSHFVNDWIRIWVGDTSNDCEDRAVFATQLGTHGDWAGSDNPGAIGGEYRTARTGSDWYYVWVRGPGFALPASHVVNLGDNESQNVTFLINATSVGGSTYYAYAEQLSNSSVNDTSGEFDVFVYPPPMVEFLLPPTYVADNDVNITLNTSYFLEGLDSIWWSDGTSNFTYLGPLIVNFDDGIYTLTAYANDTTGYLAMNEQTLNVNQCGLEVDSDLTLEYDMDCSEYDGDVITVTGNDVTIDCDGHSIIGTGREHTGIYSDTVTGTVVQNCFISGFDEGIYFFQSDDGEIIDNTIEDNNYGVYLDNSDWNSVMDNDFMGNDYGFYLEYADNNQIGHNYVDQTSFSNFGSGSCPFLYLWDGDDYTYYTDLASESLGGSWFETPLYEAGIYELGDFQAEDGVYKMKVREVIPESDFFDEAKLVLVDVPEGYGVLNQWHNTYSDDEAPPKDFMTIKDPRKPLSATDRYGNNVLAEVSEKDGVPLTTHNKEPNYVILDFGPIENPEYAKLVITGWSTYQSNPELPSQKNLLVETVDENGEWVTAATFGKFTGDTRTFVFDIADIVQADDTRMRISAPHSKTVLNIIDQVMLDDSEPVDFEVTYVSPDYANLQWGGAATYTYATEDHSHIVSNEQLPNVEKYLMYGDFTKYGDVTPLLSETDEKYAIFRHGDELEMRFSDIEPKEGMDRKVFLLADVMYTIRYSVRGYISDTIEQLPFHGMSEYPYDASVENYPYDAEHLDYIDEWNTRAYERPDKVGASLPYSFNNTVFENVLIGAMGSYGIVLDNEDSTSILDNNISDFYTGIQAYYSDDTIIRGNRITDAFVGLDIYGSYNTTASDNYLDTAEGRGVMIRSDSEYNFLLDNTIISDASSDCDYGGYDCGGIFVGYSYDNLIDGNMVTAIDGFGIVVAGESYDNAVIGNTFDLTENDDDYFAILVGESPNNYDCPYDNGFLRNSIISDFWVYDDCGSNVYNDSFSGNAYYFADGTPSWEEYDYYNLTDTSSPPDGWADVADAGLPFDSGLPDGQWDGDGEDYHPAVMNVSNQTIEVELISPANGGGSFSPVTFTYIPTVGWEEQILDSCNLTVWSMAQYYYNFSDSILEDEENNFTLELPAGEYQWYVECFDTIENAGESGTWSFYIGQAGGDDDDSSSQKEKLTLDLDPACEGNVLTVTSRGDPVENAQVTIYDEDTFGDVATGKTDEDGEFDFDSCGRDVRIYVKKNGYLSTNDVFELDSCDCAVEEPAPECTADAECASDEVCQENACVEIPCECGYISERACTPYECCSDSDCEEGQICTDNVCAAAVPEPECVSDSDCPEGEECKSGECSKKPPVDDGSDDALGDIQDAQDAIDSAKAAGKDTSEAESLLSAAKEAYEQGDYEKASLSAQQAQDAAENAKPLPSEEAPETGEAEGGSDLLPLLFLLLLGGAVLLGAYLLMGRNRSKK